MGKWVRWVRRRICHTEPVFNSLNRQKERNETQMIEHEGKQMMENHKGKMKIEFSISFFFFFFLFYFILIRHICSRSLSIAPLSSMATWNRFHNHHPIEFNTNRGGINLETERTHDGTTSRLLLTRAQFRDGGNYSCIPQGAIPASGYVHVLNGKLSTFRSSCHTKIDERTLDELDSVSEVFSHFFPAQNWIFTFAFFENCKIYLHRNFPQNSI